MFLKKNNFIKKQNYSVLKGSSNQHKKNLLESPSICTYAVVFSSVVPIKDWNRQIFDRVIKEGHYYHDACLATTQSSNNKHILNFEEMIDEIALNSKMIRLSHYLDYEYNSNRKGFLIKKDFLTYDLEDFIWNLQDCKSLLLNINHLTVAIVKQLDYVYLIDSQKHVDNALGSNAYVIKYQKKIAAESIYSHLLKLYPHMHELQYILTFIQVL